MIVEKALAYLQMAIAYKRFHHLAKVATRNLTLVKAQVNNPNWLQLMTSARPLQ